MNVKDFNDRIRIVSEFDKNFLVEASAGSGKTTMLVERMVAMVEYGIDLRNIVTITFTKKAANEFYERFYRLLEKRTHDDYNPDENPFLKAPNSLSIKRDKEALKNIDLCFMGTIDAYCNTILSEHPLEANIPSSSIIVEEQDLYRPHISNFLLKVSNKDFDLDGLELSSSYKNLLKIISYDNLVNALLYLIDHRNYVFKCDDINSATFLNAYEKLIKYKESFVKIGNYISKNFTNDYFKNKMVYRYNILKQRINYFEGKLDLDLIDFKFFVSEVDTLSVKRNEIIEKNIKNLCVDELLEYTDRTIKLNLDPIVETIKYIQYNSVINFLNLVRLPLLNYLKDKGLLSFADNLFYLNKMLSNPISGEKMVKQIQKKHKFYLIDEFQDTSPLQVELFFRLTSNNFESDYRNLKLIPGSLFLVGDPKQSIYHFRGADLSTYLDVKALLIDKGLGEVLILSENFRSTKELCDYFDDVFSNDFFINKSGNFSYSLINTAKEKHDGLSGVFSYETNKEEDPKIVAKAIKSLVEDSSIKIFDRNAGLRALKYSDFMIITKGKKEIPNYRYELSKLNIPSFVEGFINFNSSDIASSIVAIIDYLSYQDDLTSYELLSSPLFSNLDIASTIDDNKQKAHDILLSLFPEIMDINTSDLPSKVIKILLESEWLITRVGIDGIDNAIALLNLMLNSEENGEVVSFATASEILHSYIDGKIERIAPLSYEQDVVHIANLHKVKGLEAKVVFLTYAKNNILNNNYHVDDINKEETIFELNNNFIPYLSAPDSQVKSLVEFEKEYANDEATRFLYVAATRAANILFISDSINSFYSSLLSKSKLQINKYTFNEPEINKAETHKDAKDVIDEASLILNRQEVIFPKSYENVSPSTIAPYNKHNIAIDEIFVKGKNDALNKGTIVHRLMEIIVKAKEKKLDISICEQIANEYDLKEYVPLLKDVYNHIYNGGYEQVNCPIKDIYLESQKYDCYCEVPFSYFEDNKLVNGTIDLLLIKDDEYIVIDYKTDNDITTDHSAQLNCYKTAIKKAFGVDAKAFIYNIKIIDC